MRPIRLLGVSLALGLTASCLLATRSGAGDADSTRAPGRVVPELATTVDAGEVALRRAIPSGYRGSLPALIAHLDEIDWSRGPSFDGADRAAFLLAEARLRMGDLDGFAAVADAVSAWAVETPYTAAIARLDHLVALTGLSGDDPAAAARALSPLLADHLAASDALEALEASPEMLEGLASVDTSSVLGREIAGAAAIAAAEASLAVGVDPTEWLERVPARSSGRMAARRLQALAALEADDVTAAGEMLRRLVLDEPADPAWRASAIALAGLYLETGEWKVAHSLYQRIDRHWHEEQRWLGRMADDAGVNALWAYWTVGSAPGVLDLDGRRHLDAATSYSDASLDLTRVTAEPTVAPELAGHELDPRLAVVMRPSPEDRAIALDLAADAYGTRARLAQVRHETAEELHHLARLRRYLGEGTELSTLEHQTLSGSTARLGTVVTRLDTLEAELGQIRDASTEHLLARVTRLRDAAAALALQAEALERLHVTGPHRDRPFPTPDGIPSPVDLVAMEATLTGVLDDFLLAFGAETPALLARSHDQAWVPGVVHRADALHAALAHQRDRAAALAAQLGTRGVEAESSDRLLALTAEEARLEAHLDSLSLSLHDHRTAVAHRLLIETRDHQVTEREEIDYGLATAAYRRTVAGDDSLSTEATVRLSKFLETHGDSSFARGEVRYHLADLHLTKARREFQATMARFVGDHDLGAEEAGQVSALFVDTAPALALYRAILEEDLDYAHRDAVLYQAGMLLADEGDPDADRLLTALVSEHPDSPFIQEAELRLGDLRFDRKQYVQAAPHFEAAATGRDASLSAIALYKLGWSRFSVDEFPEAADAFGRLLDLYAERNDLQTGADLDVEARDYLVHALARAGGAPAFVTHFDRVGPRPYEREILDELAALQKSFSLYDDVVASDRLFVSRYPDDPGVLRSVARAVEATANAGRADAAKELRLHYAPLFAPDGQWALAQSDSLAADGARYAETTWRATALEHHARAREADDPAAWQEALALYGTLLHYWPEGPETSKTQLYAGEAARALGRYEDAVAYFVSASFADSTELATEAAWQRVATTDAWYATTRPAGSTAATPQALGADSLATQVMGAADAFVERFPDDPRANDVRWRRASLSFAHGRHRDAADAFGRFLAYHPADDRAPTAASLRADAVAELGDWSAASSAYEEALAVARSAGADSLAARLEPLVPACAFRHAQETADAPGARPEVVAPLFGDFAARFPGHEHAEVALYRSALAWMAAAGPPGGDDVHPERAHAARMYADSTLAVLIERHPDSGLVRDAYVEKAGMWEGAGDAPRAAAAFLAFAHAFPADESAGDAFWKAADLTASTGEAAAADSLRLVYVDRYPGDLDAAVEIRELHARRDLDRITLEPDAGTVASGTAVADSVRFPHLGAYRALVVTHPDRAAPDILARVAFLQAEDTFAAYVAVPLDQPIDVSIEKRQKALEALIKAYQKAAEVGHPEWASAAAFRIGQALADFGTALERSERPSDLSDDDLWAYEDVIIEQSWGFYGRAETVWEDLLRQRGMPDADTPSWRASARDSLWGRRGLRFLFQPEMTHPLIAATPPMTDPDAGDTSR